MKLHLHAGVVSKFNELRTPKVSWVDFLNESFVREKLGRLSIDSKPIFGLMNAQQMIEHLSAITKIASGNWQVVVFVSDEKTARRKPFLDTENELEIGFKPNLLAEEPNPLQFNSIQEAIDDLVYQIRYFIKVFEGNPTRTVVHPFFGELDFEYWKKFQTKHFTHHFKQFELI